MAFSRSLEETVGCPGVIKSPVNRLSQKLTARTMVGGNNQAATNDNTINTALRWHRSGLLTAVCFREMRLILGFYLKIISIILIVVSGNTSLKQEQKSCVRRSILKIHYWGDHFPPLSDHKLRKDKPRQLVGNGYLGSLRH